MNTSLLRAQQLMTQPTSSLTTAQQNVNRTQCESSPDAFTSSQTAPATFGLKKRNLFILLLAAGLNLFSCQQEQAPKGVDTFQLTAENANHEAMRAYVKTTLPLLLEYFQSGLATAEHVKIIKKFNRKTKIHQTNLKAILNDKDAWMLAVPLTRVVNLPTNPDDHSTSIRYSLLNKMPEEKRLAFRETDERSFIKK
jgi:hypothetical protein